ncbi:diguanylate cyclase, partial [Candidatus Bipolaricaulota bacterium]|nr:diguanylate cyclase [Candidatus Bipolaricaulota bacterium]
EVEYRLEKSDGSYKWFRDVGSVSETSKASDHTILTGIVMDIDSRKRTEKELAQERKKLRKLHEAVDKFQQCETEEQLCHAATEATQNILNFDHCIFSCFENGELVPIASTGKRDHREIPPQQLAEGPAGEAFRKDTTITGEIDQNNSWSRTGDVDMESYMSVSIGDVGVFYAASSTERGFDKTAIGLAEILAGHLHEEIKRIRLEEELRKRAIRDPLTGVYNRRYFNETLEKEIERSERYENPIGFLMIDVNRFKEINDNYSHQVGDEMLKEVSNLLQENVRAADSVVRYGGDEFLVMMPETNGEIDNTVERLRRELEKWNAESDLLDFPLTLAMGVSHWTPEQDIGVEETLRKADARMYKDKRN